MLEHIMAEVDFKPMSVSNLNATMMAEWNAYDMDLVKPKIFII